MLYLKDICAKIKRVVNLPQSLLWSDAMDKKTEKIKLSAIINIIVFLVVGWLGIWGIWSAAGIQAASILEVPTLMFLAIVIMGIVTILSIVGIILGWAFVGVEMGNKSSKE